MIGGDPARGTAARARARARFSAPGGAPGGYRSACEPVRPAVCLCGSLPARSPSSICPPPEMRADGVPKSAGGPKESQRFSGRPESVQPVPEYTPPGYLRDRAAVAASSSVRSGRRAPATRLARGRAARRAAEGGRAAGRSRLAEAGEVVPKDELLRRVWPDTFVEEANLSVNVSILRKALGEQPTASPTSRPWLRGAIASWAASRRGRRPPPVRSPCCPSGRWCAARPTSRSASGWPTRSSRVWPPQAGSWRCAPPGHPPLPSPRRRPVEAGRQLRVDAVLDASACSAVRHAAAAQRASCLPRDGSAPLWAERFDEALTHVFAVEATIASGWPPRSSSS